MPARGAPPGQEAPAPVTASPSLIPTDPLDAYLRGLPDRRAGCGHHPPTHGHAAGCTPRFDAAHAVQFLDQVFGDVNVGHIGLCHTTPTGGMGYEKFQWLRSGVARAQEWYIAQPAGIYFRVTALPVGGMQGKRGTADDSIALPFLWADLDYGTVGHKPAPGGLPLPADEEAARQVIAALPTPSLIVHSGGGLYPIWRFKRPVYLDQTNRDEAKVRSQHWQEIIKANAARRGWHYGSGVGDLARVLRLPGSVNRKVLDQPRPCRVIEQIGEVFPR
jgi:putative DNA primase/helicase